MFFINESQGDDILNILYGLAKEQSFNSLAWHFSNNLGYMPANIIAIGSDPGGNQICISIAGPDKGSIYFWDHEALNPDGQKNFDNLYLLAPSFAEFMDKLTPNIDDQDEDEEDK